MNDQSDIQVNYELLGRYLSGEATPEEAIQVDDWIQASAGNRILFEEVSATWQGMPGNLPIQKGSVRSLFPRYLTGIAAGLLLLAGAWWWFRSAAPTPVKPISPDSSATVAWTIRQAGNMLLKDTLPDQSHIVQRAESRLRYASSFNQTGRELFLDGEAWFEVSTNPQLPFSVRVGDMRVVVLGTSFNIQESDSVIETSVQTGRVKLLSPKGDSLLLAAGQMGIYDRQAKTFRLSDHFNPNDLAYATRQLSFENISLREIAAQIEKAYGVRVIFRDERLKDLTMSSTFDNSQLTYIFDVISITLHIRYKIENSTVYISAP